MPDFRYRQTIATLYVCGFEFRASGRQPIDLGWRAAFPDWQPADEKGDEAQLLPPLRNGETAQLYDPKIEDKETRPPPPLWHFVCGPNLPRPKFLPKSLANLAYGFMASENVALIGFADHIAGG